MKKLTALLMLNFVCVNAQQDYYSLYKQISDSVKKVSKITDEHFKLMDEDTIVAKDTTRLKQVYQRQKIAHIQSVIPLYKLLIHKTIPDISFTDKNYKSYNLSDFTGQHLILNYNDLYCQTCMLRIDSTLKLIANKNIKLIVLLREFYRKEAEDFSRFGDKILLGFMTPETVDLLSFQSGNDKIYLLNQQRNIVYFDGIEPENYQAAWLLFLRTYNEKE